jgi:hypothetical protein
MWIELAQATQQVVQDAVTTAAEHGDIAEKTVTQIPLAIAIVKGIEFIKKSNVWGTRWLAEDSSRKMLQVVNVGAAFLATAGITGTFQYADTGQMTIIITGLADVGSKLFSFASQWGMQQLVYDIQQSKNVSVVTNHVVMGTGSGEVSDASTNPMGINPKLGTGDGKA